MLKDSKWQTRITNNNNFNAEIFSFSVRFHFSDSPFLAVHSPTLKTFSLQKCYSEAKIAN